MNFQKLMAATKMRQMAEVLRMPKVNGCLIPARCFNTGGLDPFRAKYGKDKESLFDQILEMKAEEVQKECLRHGLPVVDKQIHNIQRLVSFFNMEDKKLRNIDSETTPKLTQQTLA